MVKGNKKSKHIKQDNKKKKPVKKATVKPAKTATAKRKPKGDLIQCCYCEGKYKDLIVHCKQKHLDEINEIGEKINEFNAYKKGTDLRVYCAYDEHDIDTQRNEIYNGVDIVIATPKRLSKLFYLNGINLNRLQMLIVEDAEFLFRNNNFGEVSRIPESISKCQYVIFSTKFDARFERWQNSFMFNSQIVKVK